MSDNWLDSFKQALADGDHDHRLEDIAQAVEKRAKEMSVWPAIKELSYLRELFDEARGRTVQHRAGTGAEINGRLRRLYEHTNPMVRTLCDSLRRDLLIHLLDVKPEQAAQMTTLANEQMSTSVRILNGQSKLAADQPADSAGNLSAASPASTADGNFLPSVDVKFQDEIDREPSS